MADNDDEVEENDITEYERKIWYDWVDGVQDGTPLIAERFNHLDYGIYEANRHIFYNKINNKTYLCIHRPKAVEYDATRDYSVPSVVTEGENTGNEKDGG